jgi:hypothetical protein
MRRASVERHRRCRTTWDPRELRAPFSGGYGGDLDAVLSPVDDFLKAMQIHGSR